MKLIKKENRIAGGNGSTLYVSGTTEITGLTRYAVVPRENTTITSITGEDANGNTIDVLAEMGLSVGVTLLKEELWVCRLDIVITAIKLATGTVRMY